MCNIILILDVYSFECPQQYNITLLLPNIIVNNKTKLIVSKLIIILYYTHYTRVTYLFFSVTLLPRLYKLIFLPLQSKIDGYFFTRIKDLLPNIE